SELTTYLSKTEHKQLAIVRFESVFSEQISKTLNGIELSNKKPSILAETYKQIGNNDYKTIILKLKKAGVDMVFLDMVATDPLTFINQARQLSFSPKIITHAGIEGPLSMKGVDTSIFDGVIVLNWNASSDAFMSKFEAKYKLTPTNSANRAYDAVYLLSMAIVDAKSDKAGIVSALESETFNTPNGPFKFTPEHAAGNTLVQIVEIKGGKYVPWSVK
ncbi:glycosyl hydrolase family protein, partial [bacterium]|nr:glycosyl hydrolase family protein [bacterium]